MKYKVGDKVKIREDLKKGTFGDSEGYINDDMVEFSGQFTIVVKIIAEDSYTYELAIDDGNAFWNDDMLEDQIVAAKEIKTETNEELKGYKELVSLLVQELNDADSSKYDNLIYFVSVLRPDLAKLVL